MNPIPVLSATEAAAWDSAARTQYRIPSRVLMETAGRAVAYLIVRDYPAVLTRGALVVAGEMPPQRNRDAVHRLTAGGG